MSKQRIDIGTRRATPDEHARYHGGTMGVSLDVESLIYSRALIQANSGGGKTGLLRVIAEQVAASIPTVIVDKEGVTLMLSDVLGLSGLSNIPKPGRSKPLPCYSLKAVHFGHEQE